jgi:hypothetical protein
MDPAAGIAASGMQAATLRLDAAASRIVNADPAANAPVAPTPSFGVTPPLLAYDPTALVNLNLATHDFRASLLAYKASSEMFKTLLDATA